MFAFLKLRRTWSFHVLVLQWTAKKCTKICIASAIRPSNRCRISVGLCDKTSRTCGRNAAVDSDVEFPSNLIRMNRVLVVYYVIVCIFQLDFRAHNKGNLLPYNGSFNGSYEVRLYNIRHKWIFQPQVSLWLEKKYVWTRRFFATHLEGKRINVFLITGMNSLNVNKRVDFLFSFSYMVAFSFSLPIRRRYLASGPREPRSRSGFEVCMVVLSFQAFVAYYTLLVRCVAFLSSLWYCLLWRFTVSNFLLVFTQSGMRWRGRIAG